MNNFKHSLVLLFIFIAGFAFAQPSVSVKTITEKPHPRILLLKGEERIIEQSIATNPTWKKIHEAMLQECDRMMDLPPVEHIKIGRRLLDKSREALRRIFQLSYAWRMTGEQKYFDRCEKEMLAVCNFTDWNPTHFLDVAEMTMAVSIGYDWLYPKLSDQSKKIIREAIVEKGLNQSLNPKYNSWLRVVNNWNQVCNAGMTYGSLAVAEDEPELAKNIIDRALKSIELPMAEYKPDGGYPEGYGYWGYGTSFNVMFLSAVQKVFNTDFGLIKTPGFLKTGSFYENMIGPSGMCFNWSDSGLRGNLSPAMFWFAQQNNDPSLLWVEKTYLDKGNYASFTSDRLLPAVMIWGKDVPLDKITAPKATSWQGQGDSPVYLMRTSWTDPNAIFVGYKLGSPSVNHAHMDVGSFVMEADGVRWASDLGAQSYESLESKGLSIWGKTQDAQRWTIFRLNNYSHSTLIVNNELQRVKGYAKIDRSSDKPGLMYAISDISSLYENQLAAEKRGIAIVDQKYVVVRDEMTAPNQPTTVRWNMLTTATPELGDKTITLTQDGKKLILKVNTAANIQLKTWSTAPTTDYDATNPGTTLVGFEMQLRPNEKQAVEVLLVPETIDAEKVKFDKALNKW